MSNSEKWNLLLKQISDKFIMLLVVFMEVHFNEETKLCFFAECLIFFSHFQILHVASWIYSFNVEIHSDNDLKKAFKIEWVKSKKSLFTKLMFLAFNSSVFRFGGIELGPTKIIHQLNPFCNDSRCVCWQFRAWEAHAQIPSFPCSCTYLALLKSWIILLKLL